MGDPRPGVDPTRIDVADDATEILWESIAASQNAQFPAMQNRGMGETQISLSNSHIHQTSGKRAEAQCLAHGFVRPGGIDDYLGPVAVGQRLDRCELGAVGPGQYGVGHSHDVSDEGQALLVHVHHHRPSPAEFGELDDTQSNRTGPDYQDRLAWLQSGTEHSMTANGEGLDERQLFEI